MADLSASLNPVAPDVASVVRASDESIRRYPDVRHATAVLAEVLEVPPARLVLTNGGAEAIALVATLEPCGWVEHPEFSLYARHLQRLDPAGPRWRSNPSSPLGRLAPEDAAARVWDEAFWQLATGTWSRGDADSWRLGSLTKLWACPGLRIGYAIAPDEHAATALRALQPQWSVGTLGAAVIERLAGRSDLPAWSAEVTRRRAELVGLLRGFDLDVTDTDACWVLVDRAGLRDDLLPHGVILRDCTSFGMPGVHRVAVPTDRDADRLRTALARVCA